MTPTQSQWPDIYIALLTGTPEQFALADKIRPRTGYRDRIDDAVVAALTPQEWSLMYAAMKRRIAQQTAIGAPAGLIQILRLIKPRTAGYKARKRGYTTDFTVVGVDTDGGLLCKDPATGKTYNCGETLQEFGAKNLTLGELAAIEDTAPPHNRLVIFQWREHGDDDDTVEEFVYPAGEPSDPLAIVAAEHNLTFGEGSAYAINETTINDGQVITTGGRHFRINITEVPGMCVKHPEIRCEFDPSGSVTCPKCLAEGDDRL